MTITDIFVDERNVVTIEVYKNGKRATYFVIADKLVDALDIVVARRDTLHIARASKQRTKIEVKFQ